MSETASDERWRDLVEQDHDELSDAEVTSMIKLSIKRRFSPPEWQMAFEYPGPNGRLADAIAYNTLPSRNYKLVGFEFKASRSDWLREKREGAKADYFVRMCDEWYVVAGRKGIVEEAELPDGWGLMELKPNSGQIWKLVESDLPDHLESDMVDQAFLSKFMKKAVGGESNYSRADIREAKRRGYEKAKEEGIERQSKRDLERIQRKADNFDKLSEAGFDFIRRFREIDDDEIALINTAYKLVRGLRYGRYNDFAGRLNSMHRTADRKLRRELDEYVDSIEAAAEELREVNRLIDELDGGGDGS